MPLAQTMRALTLREEGRSSHLDDPSLDDASRWLELSEIPVPTPRAGQALIRVHRAPVNPSDVHFIKGSYGVPRVRGAAAGFEGVGEVVDGEGWLARALRGRRVAFAVEKGGTWAEYAVTPAAFCVPLRSGLRDEDGAGLIVNPVTAELLVDLAKRGGARAIVLTAAASQLGRFVVPLAKERGLGTLALVRRPDAAEDMAGLGADAALASASPDFDVGLGDALARLEPTVLFDAVGDALSARVFAAMPPQTRWVIYGGLNPQSPPVDVLSRLIFEEKRIEGFWLTPELKRRSMPSLLRLFHRVQGRFLSGLWRTEVAGVAPLERAIEEMPALLSAPVGKAFVAP